MIMATTAALAVAELWSVLVYFLFGAGGTACRVAISPSPNIIFGWNRRTYVEVLVGGIVGFILPFVGTGITGINLGMLLQGSSPPVQMLLKGGLVFLLSYAGSLTVGEILGRLRPKAPEPGAPSVPAPPVPPAVKP